MKSKIKIYVVAHKPFVMPVNDIIYVPIMVGLAGLTYADLPNAFVNDATGDNIANKNERYNELTALYWLWKNSDAEIVGLCHYRRFFTTKIGKIKNLLFGDVSGFIDEKIIRKVLGRKDIIVHNKTYFREGNFRQLTKDVRYTEEENRSKLKPEIIELAEHVFGEVYPDDLNIYRKVMYGKSAHLLNIMIASKKAVDDYCSWLFPYLFRLEDEIDKKYQGDKLPRVMGLIGERLLDVWLKKKKLKVWECFTINTERIDWKMWGK